MIRLLWEGRRSKDVLREEAKAKSRPLRPLGVFSVGGQTLEEKERSEIAEEPQELEGKERSEIAEESQALGGKQMFAREGVESGLGSLCRSLPPNLLLHGDTAVILPSLEADFGGKIDWVYLDPPFATGQTFFLKEGGTPAYKDAWEEGMKGYLGWLEGILWGAWELLSPKGSLILHLDWRASGYARLLLDEIFGADRFLNHIVWSYSRAARGAKARAEQYARNHDDLLWYRKGDKHCFHPPLMESRFTPQEARRKGFQQEASGRWFKTAPRGDYTDDSLERLEREGRLHRTSKGQIRIKYFLETQDGLIVEKKRPGDVWLDIPDAMHLPKGEKTGYPTQKPQALVERLMLAMTEPGDLVFDGFCGSGTTALVAALHQRRFLAADIGLLAIHTTQGRLLSLASPPAFALLAV